MNQVDPVLQKLLASICPPDSTQRRERQLGIEGAIYQHNPDAEEAREFVVAIAASLQNRFGEKSLEACLYLSHAAKALERLDTGWEVMP